MEIPSGIYAEPILFPCSLETFGFLRQLCCEKDNSKPLPVARLEGSFSHNRTKNNNTKAPSRPDPNTVIGTVHTRTMRQSNGIRA
jgi:hypothetical protein